MFLDAYKLDTPFDFKLVPASPQRDWMDKFPDRHPYRCLPMAVANAYGWWVLLPIDVQVVWNGGPAVDDMLVTSPQANAEQLLHVARSNFSSGVLTLHTGFIFRTDRQHALLAVGAMNYLYRGMTPLAGIIETSWLPYPFTFNFQLHAAGEFNFAAGSPICQILPIPYPELQHLCPSIAPLKSNPELDRDHQLFARDRDEYMRQRAQPWQRHYFLGRLPPGSTTTPGDNHVNKLRMLEPHSMTTGTPAPERLVPRRIADDDPADTPKLAMSAAAVAAGIAAMSAASGPPDDSGTPVAPDSGQPAERPAAGASGQPPADFVTRQPPGATLRPVVEQADTSELLVVPDLITPHECLLLRNLFDRNPQFLAPMTDAFFKDRVMWLDRVRTAGNFMGLVTAEKVRSKARELIGKFYNCDRPLGDDGAQLVKWFSGQEMPPHADSLLAPGEPNPTPWREFAGVLYINDNYRGGYLYFPEIGQLVKPRPGLLLGFRGDWRHLHGVSRVLSGERYTMILWLTTDREQWRPQLVG